MYVANLVIDTCAYFIHAGHQQPDLHRPVYLRVATKLKK